MNNTPNSAPLVLTIRGSGGGLPETLIPAAALCVPVNAVSFRVAAGAEIVADCWLDVPASAPPGAYHVTLEVGPDSTTVWLADTAQVEVTPTALD